MTCAVANAWLVVGGVFVRFDLEHRGEKGERHEDADEDLHDDPGATKTSPAARIIFLIISTPQSKSLPSYEAKSWPYVSRNPGAVGRCCERSWMSPRLRQSRVTQATGIPST